MTSICHFARPTTLPDICHCLKSLARVQSKQCHQQLLSAHQGLMAYDNGCGSLKRTKNKPKVWTVWRPVNLQPPTDDSASKRFAEEIEDCTCCKPCCAIFYPPMPLSSSSNAHFWPDFFLQNLNILLASDGSLATLLVLHPLHHHSPLINQNHPCHHLLILLEPTPLLLLLLWIPPLNPQMWLVCKFGKGCRTNHFSSEKHTRFLLSERRIMMPKLRRC